MDPSAWALWWKPNTRRKPTWTDTWTACPPGDHASRTVVAQVAADEAKHARGAQHNGVAELPAPVKALMQGAAKVMTTVARRA